LVVQQSSKGVNYDILFITKSSSANEKNKKIEEVFEVRIP